jgi:hypothetical protein
MAEVMTQLIGLSSATLALVVTFNAQLHGPSWLAAVAFASFACCVGSGLIAKTLIYLSHVLSIQEDRRDDYERARKQGVFAFWAAGVTFAVALTGLAAYAIVAIA